MTLHIDETGTGKIITKGPSQLVTPIGGLEACERAWREDAMREKQIAELEAILADLKAVGQKMSALRDWINPGFAMGRLAYAEERVCKAQGEIEVAIEERKR